MLRASHQCRLKDKMNSESNERVIPVSKPSQEPENMEHGRVKKSLQLSVPLILTAS